MSNGEPIPQKTAGRERWTGIVFAFLSTFFYGISNIAIRYMTVPDMVGGTVEHFWILFYKEVIGLSILLPWLFVRWMQGRFQYCSKRLVWYIILAAIVCQLIGAPLQVLGYAVIGFVIAVPVVQSSTLLGVALLGYFVFGDTISQRRKTAIAILIVAITILSVGKELTNIGSEQEANIVDAGLFLLVTAGAIVSGTTFAFYVVILRYAIRKFWHDDNSTWLSFSFSQWIGHDYVKEPGKRLYSPFPITLAMALVLAVGIVIFGAFIFCKQGVSGFSAVPQAAWYAVLVSGICNVTGFLFQVQGLRMTSAVQASLIAISQMLLLSLIGCLFFGEIITPLVMVGLGLTVCGVFMSARPENPKRT